MSDKPILSVGNNVLVTICLVVVAVCISVETVNKSNNQRDTTIESLKIEKQHELEVTKQKAIKEDKSRKRKIWEREMTPEESK